MRHDGHQTVLKFWFEEIDESRWWVKDPLFDQLIRDRFGDIHHRASQCELDTWRVTPLGRLAEILILDQFSRNIYRDLPRTFATDSVALALAQEAISLGVDLVLTPREKHFLYVPFMHSESSAVHEVAVSLYAENGVQAYLEFELKHKKIIDEYARYPHRNTILGRPSTAAEIKFLQSPDSNF